jgi:catechol 2,3-dioxygenase-like lactoylglutathione lyase family enzyme
VEKTRAIQALNSILEAAVYVDDLAVAEAFYGGILGLEKTGQQEGRHVFFRCGDTIVLVFRSEETRKAAPIGGLPIPSHGATGAGHLCFAVDGLALDGWRQRLEAAGIGIEADFCWDNGARSIYFRDPGGNSLELAERRLWARP